MNGRAVPLLVRQQGSLISFSDSSTAPNGGDGLLKGGECVQAWDAKQAELGSASAEQRAEAAFEEMCTCVERLGIQLFPNDTVFPAPHVCLRLELAACGIWPERGLAMQDRGRVASAMLKARFASCRACWWCVEPDSCSSDWMTC